MPEQGLHLFQRRFAFTNKLNENVDALEVPVMLYIPLSHQSRMLARYFLSCLLGGWSKDPFISGQVTLTFDSFVYKRIKWIKGRVGASFGKYRQFIYLYIIDLEVFYDR